MKKAINRISWQDFWLEAQPLLSATSSGRSEVLARLLLADRKVSKVIIFSSLGDSQYPSVLGGYQSNSPTSEETFILETDYIEDLVKKTFSSSEPEQLMWADLKGGKRKSYFERKDIKGALCFPVSPGKGEKEFGKVLYIEVRQLLSETEYNKLYLLAYLEYCLSGWGKPSASRLKTQSPKKDRSGGLASHRLQEARTYGQAEVAASILHNVGNVLNSVQVSAQMANSMVVELKNDYFLRSVQLLKREVDKINLSSKGKDLIDYLLALAEHHEETLEAVRTELGSTIRHVDHIGHIVSSQPHLEKDVLFEEQVDLNQYIADLVLMSGHDFSFEGIRLQQEVLIEGNVLLDRHKVAQILINLLHNARDAVLSNQTTEPTIQIQVEYQQPCLVFKVCDNGVGIDSSLKGRIFQLGYTTKSAGHGYGLHNSALVAKRLGGELVFESQGSGSGAVFTLKIPYRTVDAISA